MRLGARRDSLWCMLTLAAFGNVLPIPREHTRGDEVSDDCCKDGTDGKYDPAVLAAEIAEPRSLRKQIHQICSTICDICDYRKQEDSKRKINRELKFQGKISCYEVDNHHGGK